VILRSKFSDHEICYGDLIEWCKVQYSMPSFAPQLNFLASFECSLDVVQAPGLCLIVS